MRSSERCLLQSFRRFARFVYYYYTYISVKFVCSFFRTPACTLDLMYAAHVRSALFGCATKNMIRTTIHAKYHQLAYNFRRSVDYNIAVMILYRITTLICASDKPDVIYVWRWPATYGIFAKTSISQSSKTPRFHKIPKRVCTCTRIKYTFVCRTYYISTAASNAVGRYT